MKNNSLLCSNALHCNGNHEAPPQILAGGRASINIISRFYLETSNESILSETTTQNIRFATIPKTIRIPTVVNMNNTGQMSKSEVQPT